jgi:2,3-dihydroxybenzoate decarboxylase
MKIVALEESFWYEKLATEGSTVSHVRVKSAVAADWRRKLADFTEYRLPDMDRNGVDMQVLSLTSPGIQVQPDPGVAVADARTANDFLADIITEHPQRFAGLAAIPLQDPLKAAAELRRAIELGLCGPPRKWCLDIGRHAHAPRRVPPVPAARSRRAGGALGTCLRRVRTRRLNGTR